MNLEQIRKELDQLERSCVTDIENQFAEHIYIDYYEMQHIYVKPYGQDWLYLLGDSEFYHYYIELSQRLNEVLMEVIHPNYHENDEAYSLSIKGINLKRIIDLKLLELTGGDYFKIYQDLGIASSRTNDTDQDWDSYIHLNPREGKSQNEVIKSLYDHLKNYAMILNEYDENWINNFTNEPIFNKIIWSGNMKSLAGLLKYLSDEGHIFNKNDLSTLIINHFIIKDFDFNKSSLERTLRGFNFRDQSVVSRSFPFLKNIDKVFIP